MKLSFITNNLKMKKKQIIILFFVGMLAFFSYETNAQQLPQLTEKFEVKFNQESIQKSSLTLDIKSLDFKSELQSRRFFDAISDNLISYKLDYKRKTVLITLQQANLKNPWKASEWNTYFADHRKRYLSYFESISNKK